MATIRMHVVIDKFVKTRPVIVFSENLQVKKKADRERLLDRVRSEVPEIQTPTLLSTSPITTHLPAKDIGVDFMNVYRIIE